MTDYVNILKENGIEIPEDKGEAVKKAMRENYKTIAEFDGKIQKLNDELSEAKGTITKLNVNVEELKKNGADVADLQKQLEEYQEAEENRKQVEAEAKRLEGLKNRFNPLKGEHEFLNEATEEWYFNKFTKALEDEGNKGKSDAEVYEALTKDQDVYKPESGSFRTPPARSGGKPIKSDEAYLKSEYAENPFF